MRALLGAGLLALSACFGGGASSDELVVSAAASLADLMAELAVEFEGAHPDVEVTLNIGGSSALREQILEGAPADVFASANLGNMVALHDSGDVAESHVFATNDLAIAVPQGNPGEVEGLDDFERVDLFLGLCDRMVPCGQYAAETLESAGVVASIDTFEPDVRALLTKVAAGELDAGVVYTTDVKADDNVDLVVIPPEHQVRVEYPIAVVTGSDQPALSAEFVEFALSQSGREIIERHGFGTP